jgi:hypothetical protein
VKDDGEIMKNKFAFVTASATLLLAVIGCSSINPLSSNKSVSSTPSPQSAQAGTNKPPTDKTVETAGGNETIGVPECDEVMDMLTAEANNPDDGYIVKAGKALAFNKIKQSIRESVDKNKGDTAELAKTCRDAKVQLEKAKAEQESKNAK